MSVLKTLFKTLNVLKVENMVRAVVAELGRAEIDACPATKVFKPKVCCSQPTIHLYSHSFDGLERQSYFQQKPNFSSSNKVLTWSKHKDKEWNSLIANNSFEKLRLKFYRELSLNESQEASKENYQL